MSKKTNFKALSLIEKQNELNKIKKKYDNYEDFVPVLIDNIPTKFSFNIFKNNTNNFSEIKDKIYLLNKNVLVNQFISSIRKKCKLSDDVSLFIHINDMALSPSLSFDEVMKEYKNDEGILYLNITLENTFG